MTNTPNAAPGRAKDWKALRHELDERSKLGDGNSVMLTIDEWMYVRSLASGGADALLSLTAAENDRTSGRVTEAMVEAAVAVSSTVLGKHTAKMLRGDADQIRDLQAKLAAREADRDLSEKGRLIVTRELVRLLDYIEEMDARQSNTNANAMFIDARTFYGLKSEAITARSNAFEQQLNNAIAATHAPRSEAGEGKK